MHRFNPPSTLHSETVNKWNNSSENSSFVRNFSDSHHEYYESKMVFGDTSDVLDNDSATHCAVNDGLDDAISFLGTDTGLLSSAQNDPVSIRVVWNLLENVSRVYLPKISSTSVDETVCLSVKGDPYSVRENGVMLDALNYVRMLFSETARAMPAF
ncbi:hypothetical protein [Asaia bogorensis]|uniref:hypothetical protein n=1 Tax=Asaia bogorensis TaxID=91915 RepID=UPI0013CF1349|nr:hypothetical protein [Asaia bogorensis]